MAPKPMVRKAIFVLADISGYTQFISSNRTALEHSQLLINELLAALIREADIPLQVAKLEGDAAFLYAVRDERDWERRSASIRSRLMVLFDAFAYRLSELRETITCNCSMCSNVDRLKLKIVVHSGEALFTRVEEFDELLGVDVILAHRLMKNSVPSDEYLLLTEAAQRDLGFPTDGAVDGSEAYDSLGETRTYVYDPADLRTRLPELGSAGDDATSPQMARLTRRGLLWSGVSALSMFGLQHWLATRPQDNGIPWPLRRVLEINERLSRDYFRTARLAPTFPVSAAKEPRPNGEEGLGEDFDPTTWKLTLEGLWDTGKGDTLELTLAQIKGLPRVEIVTELKCIEGWSEVVHWTGARLADLIARHPPTTRSGDAPDLGNRPDDLVEYVGLETPDGGYYVGLDMASALHPQTLLCYEMNGAPLTPEHGAPLRLAIPVKYGIKNIKRIGTIRFTDQRPPDYWAERGYDWYAGH